MLVAEGEVEGIWWRIRWGFSEDFVGHLLSICREIGGDLLGIRGRFVEGFVVDLLRDSLSIY